MNIVSNFIFHCNNCDANGVFVEFPDSADQHGCSAAPRKGSLDAKFTFKGTSPPIILARIDRPMNALQLCCWQFSVFTQRNFVADFLQAKCNFTRKRPFCLFEPLWGLRGNVRWSFSLFSLVSIELFTYVLRLRRYERISIENRRFRSNAVSLTENFR